MNRSTTSTPASDRSAAEPFSTDRPIRSRAVEPARRLRGPVSPIRRAAAIAVVAGLAVLTAACGDDDVSASPTTSTKPATVSSTTAPSTTKAPAGPGDHAHHEVPVTAVDFAFQGLPATVEAGTRLTLTNGAAKELHELVAIRLPDTEKRPVAELMELGPAEVEKIIGGAPPATVLLAPPGADQISAVGDGTLTEPGRYVLLCAIPMGIDPAEYLAAAAAAHGGKPDVKGGPPHLVAGMYAEITVV
jgi:hypothetical protein